MKRIIILLAIALTAALDASAQSTDTVQLPYTANFTQGWTATGGATILNSNLTKLDGYGQTLTSPWIQLGGEGSLFYEYWYYRDTASGVPGWEYLDDGVQYSIYIKTQDGTLHNIFIYGDRARFSQAGYGNTLGNMYNGQLIQIVIQYEETTGAVPVFFPPLKLDQSTVTASITAPVTARVGDTVVISGIASLPAGAVANGYAWWITNSNGDWLSLDANDSVFSVVSQNDSCKTLVWHIPGQYDVNLHVSHGIAFARATHSIFIFDTTFYEEDSIYYTSAAKDTVIGCHPQLHNAVLPESVRMIADSAFFNLAYLSSVSLPDGLRRIGYMSFAWNQGLDEVTIPRGVEYIGNNAFWWDTNITVVNFNAENCLAITTGLNDNGDYFPAFIGCNNLTTIHFGERVKRIPDFAFGACYNLTGTLVIPDSVTYIGSYAFDHWRMDNPRLDVVLGRSVSEIGEYAFWFFHYDNTFTIRNANPPSINQHSFDDQNGSMFTTLFVPCGSRNAYQNAPYWSGCFADITEDCDGIEEIDLDEDIKVSVNGNNILVIGANGLSVNIYDVMGRMIKEGEILYDERKLSVPTAGVYLVKIGDLPARKVVVL